MNHSFDIDIAKEYGINAAVIYENIRHWAAVNKANGRNVRDGYAWTYNSVKAFGEIFPYLSYKQIRAALKTLASAGLIISGVYNKDPRDRTKWYTTEDGNMQLPTGANDELPSRANGDAPQGEPLPDINTVIKPNEKTDRGGRKPFTPPTLEEVREYVKEKGYHFSADTFFAYYDSQNWRKGNGQKVSKWKQCCVIWESKEQNKPKGGGLVGENGVALLPESERDHILDGIL